jgi:hypothetical protein
MAKSISFFSPTQARRPINQYLCIILISVMCLWTVVYYLTHSIDIINESLANVNSYSAETM